MFKQIKSLEEFHSLLDYYISCIEKEDISSLTFNFKLEGKKFYSDIFKEEPFFLHKKEQIKIKKSKELESIFKNYKLLQKNSPIFYGYPLFMDSNGNISPIFFVEIFVSEEEDSFIFTRESVNPDYRAPRPTAPLHMARPGETPRRRFTLLQAAPLRSFRHDGSGVAR